MEHRLSSRYTQKEKEEKKDPHTSRISIPSTRDVAGLLRL
jgi:hypothetical protein